jgi:microcystin-dependent protein
MSLTNDQITAQNFSDFYNKISPYLGIAHAGFTPVGAIVIMTGNEVPANHLACDGTVYNISAYPELAAYYARSQGACNFYGGDGTTTFAVPDLRGELIRGAGQNSHAGQGSGGSVGEHQDATSIPNIYYDNTTGSKAFAIYNSNENINASSQRDSIVNGSTGKGHYIGGTSEWSNPNTPAFYTTRPTNTSFLICVAAKNIFNDVGNNYSLEEQEVGTWIDGKPIYQKTVNIGSLPNNTTKSVPHGIANYDYAVSIEGFAKNSSGTVIPIPYVNQSAAGNQVRVSTTSTNIDIGTGMDFSAYTTAYVTLRYTKVSS